MDSNILLLWNLLLALLAGLGAVMQLRRSQWSKWSRLFTICAVNHGLSILQGGHVQLLCNASARKEQLGVTEHTVDGRSC